MANNRSGYEDGDDMWAMIRYRGAVASAIRGRRGQEFLAELVETLDAMPTKTLIRDSFSCDGGVCALGSVYAARGVSPPVIDDYEHLDPLPEDAALDLGIAPALAAEIMYMNDERGPPMETAEARWQRVRRWLVCRIRQESATGINNNAEVAP